MWSHPTRTSAPARGGYAASLPPREWRLLVRLPARTLAAVMAIRCESSAVDGRLAAVAAIAAGRTSECSLIREVVACIYAGEEPPDETGPPPSAVLADCAAAGRVLAQRVPASEAAGYREWIGHISTVGVAAGQPSPDDPIGAAQRRLLQEYERALAG
jgi:hypothetical protein